MCGPAQPTVKPTTQTDAHRRQTIDRRGIAPPPERGSSLQLSTEGVVQVELIDEKMTDVTTREIELILAFVVRHHPLPDNFVVQRIRTLVLLLWRATDDWVRNR